MYRVILASAIIIEIMKNYWSGKVADNPDNLEVLPQNISVFHLASYWQLRKTTQNQPERLFFFRNRLAILMNLKQ